MLQALLHRKLTRPEEGLEDLLTSNIFGLLKYLKPQAALLPFLGLAWDPIANRKLADILRDVEAVESWQFWPTLMNSGCISCEPDVLIALRNGNGRKSLLLIESKYRSGKSSEAAEEDERPNDQLAREFDNLRLLADSEGTKEFAVVYITTDFTCPLNELQDSAREYQLKRSLPPAIYWLSWRALINVLEPEAERESEIARDLLGLMLALDLTTFCRLRFEEMKVPRWGFEESALPHWAWVVRPPCWRFLPRITKKSGNAASLYEDDGPLWFQSELLDRADLHYEWEG